MNDDRKLSNVDGVMQKRWYRSTTFLATAFTESCFVGCYVLTLQFELNAELTEKVLSAIILAMTVVAISFIAPKIAHDAITRLPAVKGVYDQPPPAVLGVAHQAPPTAGAPPTA